MKIFSNFGKINSIVVISLASFALSFFVYSVFNFGYPLYLTGFFVALFVPGLALLNIFDRNENYICQLFKAPLFTIFFFTPIYYGLTLILSKQINFATAFYSICVIAILSLIITYKKKNDKNEDDGDNKFLFFGLILFLAVHLLTILSYKFIPEVDGYTDLMRIENIISSGIFNVATRPLFSLLASYISIISQIPPYWLFKFGMVLLQISGIYYLYQIAKIAGITKTWQKYLILLSLVSVPVINLEVDGIRPNVIFIFALLPFTYYLSRGSDGFKKNFIFSSTIVTVGLLFHEFFGILFFINLFFIFNYFYTQLNNFKKLILLISTSGVILITFIYIKHFTFLRYILYSIDGFMKIVMNGIQWKWWFLDSYVNMGGSNLGWNGFVDVLKYYAYSLSPFLVFILLGSIFTIIVKIKKNEEIFSVEKIAFSILFIGLFFAEFLPRIDFKTLPDRFWPMIVMSLIILAPFAFSRIKFLQKKFVILIVLALLLIGLGGSVYIAKAKGGYISKKEYAAAQWIKENTPEDSSFITQVGNSVMLMYFAKREIIVPPASFFLNKNILSLCNSSLNNLNNNKLTAPNINLQSYFEKIDKEKLAKDPKRTVKDIYVLYSLDKFNNYYGQRQWWRDDNFYGADLNKFKYGYDLIYNNNDTVFIWKKN